MSRKLKLAEHIVYASKATKIARASRLGIAVSAILTFLIFAISYYGEVVGNFTFSVDRMAQNAGITMYEDAEIKDYSSRLISQRVDNADGMTILCGTEYSQFPVGHEVCIPSDEEIGLVDGPNNGQSYIAYTFYVENAGDGVVDLDATVNIISAAKGAEHALRVRVIIDGDGTTYAKPQSSKGDFPGFVEPLTEAFYSIDKVMYQEFYAFSPGDIMKVTVIIWYEGEDADHTISLVGGGVKLDMVFSITHVYDGEDF